MMWLSHGDIHPAYNGGTSGNMYNVLYETREACEAQFPTMLMKTENSKINRIRSKAPGVEDVNALTTYFMMECLGLGISAQK